MFFPEVKSKIGEDISILLKLDNHADFYMCDCGDASDLTVKDCQNTAAIFISHTHLDHFINFDTILRHQLGIGKRIIVTGPKGIRAQVQSKIKSYNWNLIEKESINYEVREIINEQLIERCLLQPPLWRKKVLPPITSNIIYQNDRFKVNFTILDHKTPSIAYLFTEENSLSIDLSKSDFRGGPWIRTLKAAYKEHALDKIIEVDGTEFLAKDLFSLLQIKKGNTLGIIMDHAANAANHQKIQALFSDTDKVFIESYHQAADINQAILNFHSYSTASGKIMRQCRIKEAIPVHFSRRYDETEIATLIKEFENAFHG